MEKDCEGEFCVRGKEFQNTKLGRLCQDCLQEYIKIGNLCGLCKRNSKSKDSYLCSSCSKWANKKEKKWYN